MEQLNLLSDKQGDPLPGFEDAQNAYKSLPKKRIHNKIPTYFKSYENYQDIEGNVFNDEETWGRMDTVYLLLSNWCHGAITELGKKNKIFDYGILRYRRSEYDNEEYTYQGKRYKDLPFQYTQAEIIGSELLGIEERLFLHETLLEYLEEDYKIEQLNGWIESLLNLCLQGFSARTIVLMLILWRKR